MSSRLKLKTGLLTPRETPNQELPSPFDAPGTRISPVFHADALLDTSCAPDLAVLSSDRILFYVHSTILLRVSKNTFSGLLPASSCKEMGLKIPVARVQSDSTVLDLILHAIYGLDMAAANPTLAQLSLAVESLLERFAVPPLVVLAPGLPLFEAILAHAVEQPLRVYCLAAHYELDPLAVAASAHMLSFPLLQLTDDDASVMGAVYLRRLFCMHIRRVQALRGLLLVPPAAHAPSARCDATKAQRAWALAIAAIIIHAKPDMAPHALASALEPLQETADVSCTDCGRMLGDCTQKLLTEWSAVKGTI